jgi:hypothetical protein
MTRARLAASVLALVLVVALAPGALAGPDPRGGGQGKGKDKGGGKPSPTPTVMPSPSPTPTVTPSPSASPSGTPTPVPAPSASPAAAQPPSPAELAPADDRSPRGETGVIKIDGRPFDEHPNNEPHVGCVFELDFSNYPEGPIEARYSFWLWPPTGRERLLGGGYTLEDDPAGGGQDLDGQLRLDLADALRRSGGEPHPQQGWHVKVSVWVPRSAGPDTKHKVFWTSCPAAAPPAVLPTTVAPTVAPTTVTPPGPLAFAGGQVAGLAALALLALLLGSGALRLSAKLRHGT